MTTIVVGLGAAGSATAYQLAKRGHPVVGIDRFAPPHPHGSTHGETRLTRQATGEGAHFPPFAIRSHEIWREIERETGGELLTVTGGLFISSPCTSAHVHVADFFSTTVAAAKQYNVPHELLTPTEIRARFPAFGVRDDERGYYEPGAGFVRPEACVAAQLALAERHGATLHRSETVLDIRQAGGQVEVRTDRNIYTAEQVVLSMGPWLPKLLGPEYAAPFTVTRQALYWFAPTQSVTPFLPDRFPVFIWEPQGSRAPIYGCPAIDGGAGGVKIAPAAYGPATSPDAEHAPVTPGEIAAMYQLVGPCFPGISSRCLKALTCLYTVTPDAGFVIDRHPEYDRVLLVSPCSGHGFKHSAAVGESVAELVAEGRSRLDLSHFALGRFQARPQPGSLAL